ncbi:MAG: hypothetical protein WBW03_15240 [Silvibacterium sp.]|jgi:hypothetical protein
MKKQRKHYSPEEKVAGPFAFAGNSSALMALASLQGRHDLIWGDPPLFPAS